VTLQQWQESLDLPEGTTWLLEASAGTGKTYQIAGLVLRLVAEYGLPVERILTITFTNAATAELRDRIRKRLASGVTVLESGVAGKNDRFAQHLLGLQTPSRQEMADNLRVALRSFDLAPISTIHGFSQRMLAELAFESGQDTELELLSDPTPILEQIVDDELAGLFHSTNVMQVALYRGAGYERDNLLEVARAMCGAVVPQISPSRDADSRIRTRKSVDEFLEALVAIVKAARDPANAAALDVLKGKSALFAGNQYFEARVRTIRKWLAEGARLPTSTTDRKSVVNAINGLSPAALRAAYARKLPPGGDPASIEAQDFWPVICAIGEFAKRAFSFWEDFAPLADFAAIVRPQFEREAYRRRVLTFDAMLSRLAEQVRDGGGADSPLAQRIRERYDAVLVDEFQDTDAAQWAVLEAAFLGHRRLILIGDPKQAIYAFRGADVQVYAQAATRVEAEKRRTMSVNYRSDQRVLGALNALWREGSNAFDEGAFDYVKVTAGAENTNPSKTGLEIRWLDDRVFGGAAGRPVGGKRPADLARLAAAEVVASLTPDARTGAARAAAPNGLAVLVNSHAQAAAVLRALRSVDVPAVAAMRSTVFATDVADWLATWLDAVAASGRDREARAAVVTPLFGWTADDLAWALAIADRGAEAREEERASGRIVPAGRSGQPWQRWTARLHEAAARWPRWGFARVFDREMLELGVLPRVLALPAGERHATDLRHLFELVHAEERRTRAGAAALAAWIRAEAAVNDDERAQRLESDAKAVRIETIHASKGLQYGHVLLPFVWDARSKKPKDGPIVLRHGGTTRIDLSARFSAARDAALSAAQAEERREDLRKLYVALTRAQHRNVVWYGPMGRDGKAAATAIGRLLFRGAERVGHDDRDFPLFTDESDSMPLVAKHLDALTTRSDGAAVWSAVERIPAAKRWQAAADAMPADFSALQWPAKRASLRGQWMVTSYTGLAGRSAATSADGSFWVGGSAEDTTTTEAELERTEIRSGRDEQPSVAAIVNRPATVGAVMPPVDLERLQRGRGTEYGTFVHEVFERIDFRTATGKDGSGLGEIVGRSAARNGLTGTSGIAEELARLLPRVLATPLDRQGGTQGDPLRGLPAGYTLGQIAAEDRLDEFEFNLRLGAGTRHERLQSRCLDPVRVELALQAALDETRAAPPQILPVRDWLRHHLERARDERARLFADIAGILTGSIDLVFRVRAAAGDTAERYFVVDYKTNVIENSEPVHFTGPWLEWKMATMGYPLQALLYTVALHRHLRLRMAERYDYEQHIGGYLYLFVRGMAGADTPRCATTGRCLGVFAHRWSRETIELLDEALSPEGT
jgi:exodeoxyribonuclease V beta subunit